MALHDLVDHQPPTEAPTDRLVGRGRRARRGRAVALTSGALAVVGMVAVAAVGLSSPGGAGGTSDQPGSGTVAATPELRLVAAAQATARTSFRFRLSTTSEVVEKGRKWTDTDSYEGVFDPNGPTGEVRQRRENAQMEPAEERIVDGILYMKKGDRWSNFGKESTFRAPNAYYIPFADPASTVTPASQLEALKDVGTVTALGTSGSGASAVERYSFTYVAKPKDADRPKQVPGEGIIEIGVQSQKISKITLRTTSDYGIGPDFLDQGTLTWEYSDYGLDVDVQAPEVNPRPRVR
ncbi:hypothetical protein [Micromonospora sp. NPDC002717]|uniref:hypothetical protein n=1 Tax=Micromonospora sp. NPDC002717 TaxID=3154424 RepID=UPI00331B2559